MVLYEFQQRVYENKVRRSFNVTDVGKEVLLMCEEFGEICDAHIKIDRDEQVDAIGDLFVYCLGLSAMFNWNADDIIKKDLAMPEHTDSLENFIPYAGKEVGLLAKTLKKSNKLPVNEINYREQFQDHVGNLMGYCQMMFDYVKVDSSSVLEGIITNNRTRTHQGKM